MILFISAWSHVDLLGTVIKISLAVDKRQTFGPGTSYGQHTFSVLIIMVENLWVKQKIHWLREPM